jgi:hypothetical protein
MHVRTGATVQLPGARRAAAAIAAAGRRALLPLCRAVARVLWIHCVCHWHRTSRSRIAAKFVFLFVFGAEYKQQHTFPFGFRFTESLVGMLHRSARVTVFQPCASSTVTKSFSCQINFAAVPVLLITLFFSTVVCCQTLAKTFLRNRVKAKAPTGSPKLIITSRLKSFFLIS